VTQLTVSKHCRNTEKINEKKIKLTVNKSGCNRPYPSSLAPSFQEPECHVCELGHAGRHSEELDASAAVVSCRGRGRLCTAPMTVGSAAERNSSVHALEQCCRCVAASSASAAHSTESELSPECRGHTSTERTCSPPVTNAKTVIRALTLSSTDNPVPVPVPVSLSLSLSLSFSLGFNGHFRGAPRLAGTRMSPFWILLELRVMEVVSGDNWSYHTCKTSYTVTTNKPTPSILQAGCHSCRSTTSVKALTTSQQITVTPGCLKNHSRVTHSQHTHRQTDRQTDRRSLLLTTAASL